MKALTYLEHGKFALVDKPKLEILDSRNAVVRVTLDSICTRRFPVSRWVMRRLAWWRKSALL